MGESQITQELPESIIIGRRVDGILVKILETQMQAKTDKTPLNDHQTKKTSYKLNAYLRKVRHYK